VKIAAIVQILALIAICFSLVAIHLHWYVLVVILFSLGITGSNFAVARLCLLVLDLSAELKLSRKINEDAINYLRKERACSPNLL